MLRKRKLFRMQKLKRLHLRIPFIFWSQIFVKSNCIYHLNLKNEIRFKQFALFIETYKSSILVWSYFSNLDNLNSAFESSEIPKYNFSLFLCQISNGSKKIAIRQYNLQKWINSSLCASNPKSIAYFEVFNIKIKKLTRSSILLEFRLNQNDRNSSKLSFFILFLNKKSNLKSHCEKGCMEPRG